MNLLAIDWPTLVAFLVAEVAIVLLLAPVIIQKRNEDRAVAVFDEHLAPRITAIVADVTDNLVARVEERLARLLAAAMPKAPTVDELVGAVRQALPVPSAEDQATARAQLVQGLAGAVVPAVGPAVNAAIAEAVKGRMGALSAQAGESKASKALQEATLKARVGEKYGVKGLGALRLLAAADKDLYGLGLDAVSFAPDSLDAWLEEHADKFRLGGDAKASKIQVL